MIGDTFILWDDAKMRTRLSLEPLEVINLVPQIRRFRYLRRNLSTGQFLNQTTKKTLSFCDSFHKVKTYIIPRQRRKPQSLAILENRTTRTVQIDIHIFTIVHAELAARHHEYAICHVRNVDGACDVAAEYEAVFDVAEVEGCEGCFARGEVDDAVGQVGYCGRSFGRGG